MPFKPFSYAKKHILVIKTQYKIPILTLYCHSKKKKKRHVFIISIKKEALFK